MNSTHIYKLILVFISIAFFYGCSAPDKENINDPKDKLSCDICGNNIWTDKSQKIEIVKNDGNVLSPSKTIISYDRDILPDRAKQKLEQILIDISNKECLIEDITYDIIITDETGSETEYLSSNNSCNNIKSNNFISTHEIESLLILFDYDCLGKVYCSEMTSCKEATFYLQYCPATKMDGDNDGIPCERQWCN